MKVPGRNENGERLLETCAEQELVVGNSWFRKNNVYKYSWVTTVERRVVHRASIDYVFLPKRMRGRWLDVNMWRREGEEMSDHFLVEARLHVVCGWRSAGRMEGVRNVL